MTRSLRSVGVLALCAFAAWAGLARAQLTGPPPPPIPPENAPSAAAQPGSKQPPPACDRCGTVESIRQSTSKEQWTSLGNVPSRVGQSSSDLSPSAVTTFKIGPGFTNQGQVMIGAAGGAVYQTSPTTERNATRWEITVRMDDGTSRSVTQNYEPLLQVGDRVRVFGSQIELIQQ